MPKFGMSGQFTPTSSGPRIAGSGGGGAGGGAPLGSASNPATSAAQMYNAGQRSSGVYYINLPTVGVREVYCEMGSSWAGGGGWMLAWKCTRGSRFSWGSSYWSNTNTYNTGALNRNDEDAKFDVFNYYTASEFLAIFPDLNTGGQTSGYGSGWSWRKTGENRTCLSRFQSQSQISGNPRGQNMWQGSGFSAQGGFQWYGFYYTGGGHSSEVRWGFGWNNEGGPGSNDVVSGIGTNRAGTSAGDHIWCCQSTTGVNRSIRAEIWVK
jgi:hypothetical protein